MDLMTNLKLKLLEDMARIRTVVRDYSSIRPGMNNLLSYCFKICDSNVWKDIAKLNFEKDVEKIQRWLEKTLTGYPPPANIQAFSFGYDNPKSRGRKPDYDLYILGATVDTMKDSDATGALLKNDSYNPGGNEAKSAVLPRMHALLIKYHLVDVGDLLLCLGYASLAVKLAFKSSDEAWLKGVDGPRPVMVGDDKGHFHFSRPVKIRRELRLSFPADFPNALRQSQTSGVDTPPR